MNRNDVSVLSHGTQSALATNKVLRNTYMLLGLTFIFSAFTAFLSFSMNAKPMHPIRLIAGAYGLMFLTNATRNSPWGLVSVFAFTGFLGYTV